MVKVPRPLPNHLKNRRQSVYSVPEPTAVYIKFKDHATPAKFRDEVVTLQGMGDTSFQKGISSYTTGHGGQTV